jgi:hypothetical protein
VNAFVSVAKATFSTIVAAFTSFMVVCAVWYASLVLGLAGGVYVLFYLNEITTVCIGLAAGWYVARYHRPLPWPSAAIPAILVEALHVSIGGTTWLIDGPLRIPAMLAIAAAIAMAAAWTFVRFLPAPKAPAVSASGAPGAPPP